MKIFVKRLYEVNHMLSRNFASFRLALFHGIGLDSTKKKSLIYKANETAKA